MLCGTETKFTYPGVVVFACSNKRVQPFLFSVPSPSFRPTVSRPVGFLCVCGGVPRLFLLFLVVVPCVYLSKGERSFAAVGERWCNV